MAAAPAEELLARLTHGRSRFLFPGRPDEAVDSAVARAFLDSLDAEDRALVVLVSGLGVDLGEAAFALHLDPSIVWWRLRRSLLGGAARAGVDGGALERGVTRLLRALPPGTAGNGRTTAALRLAELPPDVLERLEARLDSRDGETSPPEAMPGLGVGSLVLILLAVSSFMIYGAIRDVNPLWRGMALVRNGEYEKARTALQELGELPEGRAWVAMAWLAEGNYEQALAVLGDPGVAKYFGEFRPMDVPLPTIEADPRSRALLPRGLISDTRPIFVYRSDPADEQLTVELLDNQTGRARTLRFPLLPRSGKPQVVRQDYPREWPALIDGAAQWDVEDGEAEPTAFTLLTWEARQDLNQKATARLSHEIPLATREFLRAHYELRNGLLVAAAGRFATLARDFPEQPYPRAMLAQIGAALGVDPQVFVR